MTKLFTLADQSLAALSNPNRGISRLGMHQNQKLFSHRHDIGTKQINHVYNRLRKSVRFVVDDELLHYITDLSVKMDANQALKMMRNTARLPFPDVWFEWNEKRRVDHLNNILDTQYKGKTDHIPDRVGYLAKELFLPNDENDEELPVCHFMNFFNDENGRVCIPPTGIQMSMMGEYETVEMETLNKQHVMVHDEVDESIIGGAAVDVKDEREMATAMLGGWWAEINKKRRSLPKVLDSIRLVFTDSISWWYGGEDYSADVAENLPRFSKDIFAGDARFLIALLATINYTRFVEEPEEAKFVGRKVRYGKNVGGNIYRVLKLTLPKPMGVEVAARKFSDNPSQRRLHDVIGHYVHKKTGVRYWRNAHSRGNKELGRIIKDYELIGR